MSRTRRNLIIFIGITLSCGFAGSAVNNLYHPEDPMKSPGMLIWLVTPVAANFLLRALGKDGWENLGAGLKLRSGWRYYLLALLVSTFIILLLVGINALLGSLDAAVFTSGGMQALLSLMALNFAGNMVRNIFEELTWRGYMVPQLAELQHKPLLNATINGVVGAGWHIPYYYFFLGTDVLRSQTALSIPALIVMDMFIMPLQALLYSQTRLASGSIWTTWLMRTLANALGFAIVAGGFVTVSADPLNLIFTPGTEGILYSLLCGLAGWLIYRRSLKTS